MMTLSKLISRTAFLVSCFLAAVPAFAQVGEPNLDPSNNTTGTAYNISVQGSAKPLEPGGGQGSTGRINGTMTVFQAAGVGEFDADVAMDTDQDGSATAMLTCEGVVGSGRLGVSCSGVDEDGGSIFVLITSKAVVRNGKVVFIAGKGIGFTDRRSLTFVFAGQQQ